MNEKKLMEAVSNRFTFSTNDAAEAMDFLEWRDANTSVLVTKDVTVKNVAPFDVRLMPDDYAVLHVVQHSIAEDEVQAYDSEKAFENSVADSKLLVTRGKGYERILLRPTAIPGLLGTTLVQGSGWGILQAKDSEAFANAINCFLEVRQRPVTLIEVWGSVTGFASERYVYLPQQELFRSFLAAATDRDGELVSFQYSHELTYAVAEFPPEQVRKYSLDKIGFDPGQASMRMYMSTSDCLQSSAHVWFVIEDGDKTVSATGVYAAHKGSSAISKFEDSCFEMHKALTEKVNRLADLDQYVLQYPESTLREVGKRMQIPDRITVKAIRDAIAEGIDFEQMTAFEGYLFVCRILDSLQVSKSKTRSFCGNEELIANYIKTEVKAKVADVRWQELDEEKRWPDIGFAAEDSLFVEAPNQISIFDEV